MDEKVNRPQRGDYVSVRIPGRAGTPGTPTNYYVLGMMDYGDGFPTDIALVGDERAHGCPVKATYLTVISRGRDVSGWVDRYVELYPTTALNTDRS